MQNAANPLRRQAPKLMTAIGSAAPRLSVVITCTTAGQHVDHCIEGLQAQLGASLPNVDIARWRERFPEVPFPEFSAKTETEASSPGLRRPTYDRRRPVGLAATRGESIAQTEDHARAVTWRAGGTVGSWTGRATRGDTA